MGVAVPGCDKEEIAPLISAKQTASSKHVPNFDYLRLLLAVVVVYTHSFLNPKPLPHMPFVSPVAAFVCISGFLIPGSLATSRGYGHFAWKRILRVMPAFGVSLLLVAALDGPAKVGPVLLFYATMGILGAGLNSPLWSLALEEILYAFHATSRRVFTLPFALACVGVLTAAAFAFGSRKVGGMPAWAVLTPAACFSAGNCMFLLKPKNSPSAIAITAAVLASAFLLPVELKPLAVVISAPALVLLALLLPQLPMNPKKWADVSYGLYVYHWPIMAAMIGLGLRGWSLFGATFALTLSLAYPSWTFMERHALKAKNSPPRLRSWRAKRARLEPVETVA